MEKTLLEKVRQNVEERTKLREIELINKMGAYKKLLLKKCDEQIEYLLNRQQKNFWAFRIEICEIDDYSLFLSVCEELGFICSKYDYIGSGIYYSISIPDFEKNESDDYTIAQRKYFEYQELLKKELDRAEEIILEKCEDIKESLENLKFDFDTVISNNKKSIFIGVKSNYTINSSYDELFVKEYFSKLGFEFLHSDNLYWQFKVKEE